MGLAGAQVVQQAHRLAISPDGTCAVVAAGRSLLVIDMDDMLISRTIDLPEGALVSAGTEGSEATLVSAESATSLAFSPDEKLLAAGAANGQVFVWEI